MTDSTVPAPAPRRGAPLPVRLVPPDPAAPRPVGVRSTDGDRTGLATASLVLGIVALVLDVLLVPTVLAIVLGAVALHRGPAGRVRAIAGIVLGVAAIGTQTLLGLAIAVPLYAGAQHAAVDSAVRSALTNDRTALIGYATDEGALPEHADAAALTPYGWDDSRSVRRVVYRRGTGEHAGAFCLVALSTTGSAFVTTSHTAVAPGDACPARAW